MSPTLCQIGFLGTGNIAGPYAASIAARPELRLAGVFDLDETRTKGFAAEHGCTAYTSIEEMCGAGLDVIVNLTSAPYHHATTKQLLESGQNVYSEKPLAGSAAEARELVDLAAGLDLVLACSPSLWLGRATMDAARAVQNGTIGQVRLVTAEVNQGRIETWHPDPQLFYRVGPVVDAGVYPIAYLTAVFGPVRDVLAQSERLLSPRLTTAGESFEPETDDGWIVAARTVSGVLLRISCNYYVASKTGGRVIDFHGDEGSLRLEDWLDPGSPIQHASYGEPYQLWREATESPIDWSLGLMEVSSALRTGQAPRVGAAHAAHVTEILQAVAESAATGRRVGLDSTFPAPLSSIPDPVERQS